MSNLLSTWRGAAVFTVAVVVLSFGLSAAYFLVVQPRDAKQVSNFMDMITTAVAWLLAIYWVSFLVFRSVGFRVTASASAAPSSLARGSTATITTAVTSSKTKTLLVDIEVFDATGTRVFQQYFENQAFAANVPQHFNVAWAVSTLAEAGSHTAKVGIFIPGRGIAIGSPAAASPIPGWNLLLWKDRAATITVT